MPKRQLDLTDSEASDSEETPKEIVSSLPKRRKVAPTKNANIDDPTGVLLSNGMRLPWVGYGTYQVKKTEYKDLLIHAIDEEKYPLIDTASSYGNEELLREVFSKMKTQRKDVFIQSKVSLRHMNADCRKHIEAHIRAMGLQYLDLLLIHWPGSQVSNSPRNVQIRVQVWREMERMVRDELVRSIGVSNFEVSHLEHLLKQAKIRPVVNQCELHPYFYRPGFLQWHRQNDICLQGYSSLGNPKFVKTLMNDWVVVRVARMLGRTPAQVLLRWSIQRDVPVLPRTTKKSRLKENIDIFSFALSAEHMKALDSLQKHQKKICWDPRKLS